MKELFLGNLLLTDSNGYVGCYALLTGIRHCSN